MYSWQEIEDSLLNLQTVQTSKGIKSFTRKFFKRPVIIEKLFTDLATFEAKDIYTNSIRRNKYNEIYKTKDELFFKNFIDKELEEKYDYPIKQLTELVKFYESRRVKSLELVVAIVAAIVCGAVGALLTIYFQVGQPPLPTPVH